jgi:hypothetical protein
MSTDNDVYQIISLCFSLITLTFLWINKRQSKANDGWFWPAITYIAHVIVFYTLVFAEKLGIIYVDFPFTIWSALLRLHDIFMLMSIEIGRWWLNKPPSTKDGTRNLLDYIIHKLVR